MKDRVSSIPFASFLAAEENFISRSFAAACFAFIRVDFQPLADMR